MSAAASQLWALGTVALRAMTVDRSTQRSVADRLLVQGTPELLFIHRGQIVLRVQGNLVTSGCGGTPQKQIRRHTKTTPWYLGDLRVNGFTSLNSWRLSLPLHVEVTIYLNCAPRKPFLPKMK